MATIQAVKENIDRLNLAREGMAVVAEMKPEFLRLNKDQLLEGKVKDGSKFQERYKSESYAKYKHRRNPVPGMYVPDLYNTGAFFDAFKLDILSETQYKIDSSNSKTAMLKKRFGSVVDFFGLNSQSREDLIMNGYYDELMDRVRKVTRL